MFYLRSPPHPVLRSTFFLPGTNCNTEIVTLSQLPTSEAGSDGNDVIDETMATAQGGNEEPVKAEPPQRSQEQVSCALMTVQERIPSKKEGLRLSPPSPSISRSWSIPLCKKDYSPTPMLAEEGHQLRKYTDASFCDTDASARPSPSLHDEADHSFCLQRSQHLVRCGRRCVLKIHVYNEMCM